MTITNLQLKNIIEIKNSPGLVEAEKALLLTEKYYHKTHHDTDLQILSKS